MHLNLNWISIWTFMASLAFATASLAAPIPDPLYERLFPHYAQLCGFGKKTGGNPGGHAILYVKGVCRDKTSDRPLIKRCTDEELNRDPNLGTSLSVDPIARNAWWMGMEDLNFVLFGDLKSDEALTEKAYRKILDKAVASEAYEQIYPIKPSAVKAESLDEYLSSEALGTDFAISLARQGSCWKIPLSTQQVDAIVQEANSINQVIDKARRPHWNFLSNNCVHFVVNLLAAAGVNTPSPAKLLFPAFLFYLEAPAGRILKMGRKINKGIPTIKAAFKDKLTRETLTRLNRMPLQYGTVLERIYFHELGNRRFNRHFRFIFPGDLKKLEKMEKDPIHTDLHTHLVNYLDDLLSARALFRATPLEALIQKKKYDTIEFARFYRTYEAWLDYSLTDITSKIAQLIALTEERP